jgi:diaminopimelate decarboxylase
MPVAEIARRVGTPFYLYSRSAIERQYGSFESAFSPYPHLTCYAVKANSNLTILEILRALGSGFDIVSGGELLRALEARAAPERIVFSGVGKTEREIDLALGHGIHQFNVESASELKMIRSRARALGRIAPISLRVNPNVNPHTHPYHSTGMIQNKFGIPREEAADLLRSEGKSRHLKIQGISFHIGTQITCLDPFLRALRRIKGLFLTLKDEGFPVRNLDVGGGLGIRYRDETPPPISQYAKAIIGIVKDLGCTLLLEPGRVIVGNAGILVTRVLLTKQHLRKSFVVVDAALNDLMRPSLYGAHHEILPEKLTSRKVWCADVVGPICESGDFFAKDRKMAVAKAQELLAIGCTGAYGFALSSNYNSRPRVPEVMVYGNQFEIIRQRESFEDLIRGERQQPNSAPKPGE